MTADDPLAGLNTTELVQLARAAGHGNLPRDRELLREALLTDDPGDTQDALNEKRVRMEAHIKKYYARMRTQLPDCTGKCTSFGCPDLIVQRCWMGMRKGML